MATTYTTTAVTPCVIPLQPGHLRVRFDVNLEVTVRKATSYSAYVTMDLKPGSTVTPTPRVDLYNASGNQVSAAKYDYVRQAMVLGLGLVLGLDLAHGVKLSPEQAQALYDMAALYPED